MGLIAAFTGGFFVYSSDRYDLGPVELGNCTLPRTGHRVVYGTHAMDTVKTENQRAKQANVTLGENATADLTKAWLVLTYTNFRPMTAYNEEAYSKTKGTDLTGQPKEHPTRVLTYQELLPVKDYASEAELKNKEKAIGEARPISPNGACVAVLGRQGWYPTVEPLLAAVGGTQESKRERSQKGLICLVVGLLLTLVPTVTSFEKKPAEKIY